MASEQQKPQTGEESSWGGDFNPFADPEERRVLFAAFDSFRYVGRQLITTYVFLACSFSIGFKQPIAYITTTICFANSPTDNIGELRI